MIRVRCIVTFCSVSALVVILFALTSASSFAKSNAVLSLAKISSKIRAAHHISSVSSATFSTLRYGSKQDNIQSLLGLVRDTRKLTIQQEIMYLKKYSVLADGDSILLACLKTPACDLDITAEMMKNKSALHRHVFIRLVPSNEAQLNQGVGRIAEHVMHDSYKTSGWSRLDSVVRGNKGVDGLYIKRKGGVISDVLIAETKYGMSQLGNTLHGKQMSKEWVLNNLMELIKKYPDNKDYKSILEYVRKDNYRAQLFNLVLNDDLLKINVENIFSRGKDVTTLSVVGRGHTNQTMLANRTIRLDSPENNYHRAILDSFSVALDGIDRAGVK